MAACSSPSDGGADVDAGQDGSVDAPRGPAVLTDDLASSTDGAPCAAGTTTSIEHDEVSALGFSASDVLAYAAGSHETQLVWADEDALSLDPAESGEQLTVRIEPRGHVARLHDPDVDVIGAGGECRPWIEIDVEVIMQSTSTALHERFAATLVSEDARVAFLAATAEGPKLQGALRAERDGQPPEQLDLAMTLTATGVSGSLVGLWTGLSEPVSSLAYFGHRSCRPKSFAVAKEQVFEGISPASVLEQLAATSPLAITWLDGSPTTATVRFEPEAGGAACARVNDWLGAEEGVSFEVLGTLQLDSADGRLRLSTEATVGATIEASSSPVVAVGSLTSPAETTAAALGFPGIDGSAFQPLHLELIMTLGAEGPTGVVGLNGVRKSNCVGSGANLFCEERTEQLERGVLER